MASPSGPQISPAKKKRAARDKARRERAFRLKKPNFKDRFVTGCFLVGLLATLVLAVALTYSCFVAD